jgi:uncharacterized protein (DUF58 family)
VGGRSAAPLFLVGLVAVAVGVYLTFGLGVALMVTGVVVCVGAVFFYEPAIDAQRKEEQRKRAQQAQAGKLRFEGP